jgi:hypothetical protein
MVNHPQGTAKNADRLRFDFHYARSRAILKAGTEADFPLCLTQAEAASLILCQGRLVAGYRTKE